MGRGVSSEGRDEEEGSGEREVTGESSAGKIGVVEEVAISESRLSPSANRVFLVTGAEAVLSTWLSG